MKALLRFPAVLAVLLCCCFPAISDAANNPPDAKADESAPATETISIPGPMRSFLRMAAISQKVSPERSELLARNVYLLGYEGPQNSARQTEFLILLNRYVQQARELVNLGGSRASFTLPTAKT